MTATPGRPEDWADINPESTTPERILPTPEGMTPSATKVAMVCYAVGAAAQCWEHPERAGVFDSDRASQIVTELCVALGVEQQGDAAPESARPAPLSDEHGAEAPGQGEDSLSPSEPVFIDPSTLAPGTAVEVDWPSGNRGLYYVDQGGYQIFAGSVGDNSYRWGEGRIVRVLTEDKPTQEPAMPRPIEPEDVRVGMVVEQRKGEGLLRDRVVAIEGGTIKGEVAWLYGEDGRDGWSLWLIEDAPAPVDPDAAAVEALVTAYRRSPECSTDAAFGEAVLDYLRAQGFDVTPRAEQ